MEGEGEVGGQNEGKEGKGEGGEGVREVESEDQVGEGWGEVFYGLVEFVSKSVLNGYFLSSPPSPPSPLSFSSPFHIRP